MSDEVVFEQPPSLLEVGEKHFPKVKIKKQEAITYNITGSFSDKTSIKKSGDILRLKMGQKIECDCGRCQVDREGDRYIIHKGFYHHKDSCSEWLICPHCDDRIKIHPIVDYIEADAKGIKE